MDITVSLNSTAAGTAGSEDHVSSSRYGWFQELPKQCPEGGPKVCLISGPWGALGIP